MSRTPKLLTPKDIHDATFNIRGFRRDAYDADQMDELLDNAEHTIRVLARTAHNTWKEQQ